MMWDVFLSIVWIQLGFFAVAAAFKTDKVTDLAYGLTFVVIAQWLYFTLSEPSLIQAILLVMVSIWGLRLAGYLLIRIFSMKRDSRFDGVREHFVKFLSFWTLQAISIWIILLPTTLLLNKVVTVPISWVSMAGIALWLFGLIYETVADWQKFVFKNDKANASRWISSGLWSRSRHPNYFGEMLCWWGIFLMIVPYLMGIEYLSIIGPLFITLLLRYGTGVPTLEKKYRERYKGNASYTAYKKRTPLLVPRIF